MTEVEVPQSDKVNKLYLKSQVKQTPPGYKLNRHTPKTHSEQLYLRTSNGKHSHVIKWTLSQKKTAAR